MIGNRKFHYKTLHELQEEARKLGIRLPFADNTDMLCQKLYLGNREIANRCGIAPMEGADAETDGSPSELTTIRYCREAEGGCGVIWFEAISIVPEGRSGRTQLYIARENLDAYKRLIEKVREAGRKKNGYEPYLILQANHSGRYSNPNNKPAPLIAYRHPVLERTRPVTDENIVSDSYLERLEEIFGQAAGLAKEAGFDAVDIKSCHGYLLAELTSAYTRPGRYGGSYENRTRFLKNAIRSAIVHQDPYFTVTARVGIYDGYEYPYGFGVREGNGLKPDLAEPIQLVRELKEEMKMAFIGLTMGNPYNTTHITRPFDIGKYEPPEHPLTGIGRMIGGIGEVKRQVPDITIFASAPSYLRQFSDLYSAGAIEYGFCDGMLFGRLSFAQPDFMQQIKKTGRIDEKRVCVSCGKCGDLIRAHLPTGCVVRNPDVYMPYYREYRLSSD